MAYEVIARVESPDTRLAQEAGCPLRVDAVQVSRNGDTGEAYLQARVTNASGQAVEGFSLAVELADKAGASRTVTVGDAKALPAGTSRDVAQALDGGEVAAIARVLATAGSVPGTAPGATTGSEVATPQQPSAPAPSTPDAPVSPASAAAPAPAAAPSPAGAPQQPGAPVPPAGTAPQQPGAPVPPAAPATPTKKPRKPLVIGIVAVVAVVIVAAVGLLLTNANKGVSIVGRWEGTSLMVDGDISSHSDSDFYLEAKSDGTLEISLSSKSSNQFDGTWTEVKEGDAYDKYVKGTSDDSGKTVALYQIEAGDLGKYYGIISEMDNGSHSLILMSSQASGYALGFVQDADK